MALGRVSTSHGWWRERICISAETSQTAVSVRRLFEEHTMKRISKIIGPEQRTIKSFWG